MSVLPALKYIVVNPKAAHTSTIIFLHGLGDTGAGWKPVAEMLSSRFPETKWVLPHARMIPVTINFRMMTSSWFDITSLSDFDEEDEKGMLSAARSVNEIITAEVDAGIPSNKIVLGGFSQGCALALLTGITAERKLAGLATLSGWLPMRNKVKAMMSDHARNLPVFWGHGTDDKVVDYSFGVESVNALKELGFKDMTFKSYDIGHSSHPDELRDLEAWLRRVLSQPAAKS